MIQILKKIGFAFWSVLLFAAGVFFAMKIDKPDTVVNNDIKGIKIKGDGNNSDVTSTPNIVVENKKEKKKFRLFKRKAVS